MAKVNREMYRNTRPKLMVEDIGDADYIVLTIKEFREDKFDFQGRKKLAPFLMFEEAGEKVQWLNPEQIQYLIDALGDETDEWIGKRIPIMRHEFSYDGKDGVNLWIASPELWDSLLNVKSKKTPKKG